MITKRSDRMIQSNLTPRQFAEAVQSLDLQSIPPEKRSHAMAAHIGKIMYHQVADSSRRHELITPSLLLPRN